MGTLTFVHYPDEPGEGLMFPAIFTRCCWSLIVYQAVIGGTLGLQSFPAGAAIFVLGVGQLCFWLWTDKTFHDMSKFGPLYVAQKKQKENVLTKMKTKVRSGMKLPTQWTLRKGLL